MFWQKEKSDHKQDNKIILGMVMLENEELFNLENFIEDYNSNFSDKIQQLTGDSSSLSFIVDDEPIAIGHMPMHIPSGDIDGTAKYAYNWPTAVEDIQGHKGHLIVSVIGGGQNQIKRFKIFTQVLCSLLRTTDSIGVYKGSQSLLLQKHEYLYEGALMSKDYLPLNLWIYFGLRENNSRNSGYTYGLKEFGKIEMEVLGSTKSLADIRGLLFNIASYVLDNDVTFKSGQTIGLSEDEKILITLSSGEFVEGNSFKLAY